MIVVEYRQIELDYCTNCNGVWFDAGELELMLERVNLKPNVASGKSILDLSVAATTEKKRKCPNCGRKMRKELIGGEPKILVDTCPVGEGLWFDGGEVDALLSELSEEAPGAGGQVVSFLQEVFQGENSRHQRANPK
jgi:Zn-finger nucleic acid-binding protein